MNPDGTLKPFERFLNDVRTVDETYNRRYLRAEYDFVHSSAQMAARWEEMQDGTDRYNLQYRTVGDGHVRPEHAALHGVTLPATDPFWDSYFPPNGWGCRCTAIQVRKTKYPETSSAEAWSRGAEALRKDKKGIFRFNPGKQQKAMPDYNPYTISRCRDCDLAKGKTRLARAFVPDSELCEACRLLRECWKKAEKDAPEVFYECKTTNGKLRVSSRHGKNEKKENVRVGTYLAEKHGYEIDLIANPSDKKTADSMNKTLGYEQEYKVNNTPTKNSVDRLLRDGKKQADSIVLSIESDISLENVAAVFRDRVSRAENLKEVTLVLWNEQKDATYTRKQILSPSFKIRPEDFK